MIVFSSVTQVFFFSLHSHIAFTIPQGVQQYYFWIKAHHSLILANALTFFQRVRWHQHHCRVRAQFPYLRIMFRSTGKQLASESCCQEVLGGWTNFCSSRNSLEAVTLFLPDFGCYAKLSSLPCDSRLNATTWECYSSHQALGKKKWKNEFPSVELCL